MKSDAFIFASLRSAPAILSLAFAALVAGCGSSSHQQAAEQEAQELARLRQENEELKKLKAENRELDRLRKDNQELPKLRGQQEEITRVQQDNERLRQQIASVQANAAAARAANLAAQANPGSQISQPGLAAIQTLPAHDPNVAQTNDELFLEPRFLKILLPGFDWDKLQRTEPLSVKGLLEQNGIVITNYQQLNAMGITNYRIQRPTIASPAPVK